MTGDDASRPLALRVGELLASGRPCVKLTGFYNDTKAARRAILVDSPAALYGFA